MRKKRKLGWCILLVALAVGLTVYLPTMAESVEQPRQVSEAEKSWRSYVIETAEDWMGCNESDGSHKPIIDVYNAHKPLARGYAVQYDDAWCSTFVSAVAIQCGITEIIPTECGCERQIWLFQELGAWVEDDDYAPLPGDIIFYCWECSNPSGDCHDWSAHVGIVTQVDGSSLVVIEGNKEDEVAYRYIDVDDPTIRGYGTPDYRNWASRYGAH